MRRFICMKRRSIFLAVNDRNNEPVAIVEIKTRSSKVTPRLKRKAVKAYLQAIIADKSNNLTVEPMTTDEAMTADLEIIDEQGDSWPPEEPDSESETATKVLVSLETEVKK